MSENPSQNELDSLEVHRAALMESIAFHKALPDAEQRKNTIHEEQRRLSEIRDRIAALTPAPAVEDAAPAKKAKLSPTVTQPSPATS